MRAFAFRILAIAAVLLASFTAQAAEPRIVVVFGDSLTAGGMLPAADRGRVWVKLVEAQSGGRLRMINEGKGGRPTDSVKEFEAMLVRRPRADVLVIALGGNDSRDISEHCVPKAVANLTTMIAKGRATYGEKLEVLLVGPANIYKEALGPTKPIANEREAKLKELGAAFALLAKEEKCGFVSLFGVVPDTSLAKDGVHPDAAGNEAIAKAMGEKLLLEGAR
jgi:acyl-CoA thioesterase I